MRYYCFALLISFVLVVCLLTNNSVFGEEVHIHGDICYPGIKHTHTENCYSSVQVSKYCSGIWYECGYMDFYDGRITAYDSYCTSCGSLMRTDSKIIISRANMRYYNSRINRYFDSTTHSNSSSLRLRDENMYCYYCRKTVKTRYVLANTYTGDYTKFLFSCDGCGAMMTGEYTDYWPEGTGHGTYYVTERKMTCTKKEGAYYDANGRECGLICDKTIVVIEAENPVQRIKYGESIDCSCRIRLLNGEEKVVVCDLIGLDLNKYSITQNTLLEAPEMYAYYVSDDARPVLGRARTEISVELLPRNFVLTFDSNGGEWEGSITKLTRTVEFGTNIFESGGMPVSPKRTGMLFDGWYLDRAGIGKFNVSEKLQPDGDMLLYAKWIEIEEGVCFYEYDDLFEGAEPFPVEGFLDAGSDFWRMGEKDGNGVGRIVRKGDRLRLLSDITLYGHWESLLYKVTFVADDDVIGEKEVAYHGRFGILPVPERNKSNFLGWFSSKEGGVKVTQYDCLNVPCPVVLYAQYSETEIIQEINLSGKIISVNNEDTFVRDANERAIVRFGNRIGFRFEVENLGDFDRNYRIVIRPNYYFETDSNEKQVVHLFSTGVKDGKIITFFEQGKDYTDEMVLEVTDNETVFFFTFPHMSYVVTKENLEWFEKSASCNSISGKEDFFEKEGYMLTEFEINLTDDQGNIPARTTVPFLVDIKRAVR